LSIILRISEPISVTSQVCSVWSQFELAFNGLIQFVGGSISQAEMSAISFSILVNILLIGDLNYLLSVVIIPVTLLHQSFLRFLRETVLPLNGH
jgi:hypothetical protein